jgi:hypothetical protein
MNKCFSDYELTCRVENELRNTSESNLGDLWKILTNLKDQKGRTKLILMNYTSIYKI